MKRLIISILFIFVVGVSSVFSYNQATSKSADCIQAERAGCCSRHGGVCGCTKDHRAKCCDGTLSPSCGC